MSLITAQDALLIGAYQTICGMLNAFEIPGAGDQRGPPGGRRRCRASFGLDQDLWTERAGVLAPRIHRHRQNGRAATTYE
jgi:hypothetical protein